MNQTGFMFGSETIDQILVNSFMDLCVKFQQADKAIDLYNIL
jgi:hypothetical protein